MARPCSNLNDKLQAARNQSDDCWDTADLWQKGASITGIGAAITCASIIPTIGGPFALGGGSIARDKLIAKCLGGTGGFLAGLAKLNRQLDLCNQLDRDGAAAAQEWLDCYNQHKKTLDKFLRPLNES